VTVYAQRIQSACRAFVVRMKANRVKYAALKEKARLDAEKDKTSRAARVIQKHIRRKLVVIMMRSMHSLIELRKVLARKVSVYIDCAWVRVRKCCCLLHALQRPGGCRHCHGF
jgi:hypothetical protein